MIRPVESRLWVEAASSQEMGWGASVLRLGYSSAGQPIRSSDLVDSRVAYFSQYRMQYPSNILPKGVAMELSGSNLPEISIR